MPNNQECINQLVATSPAISAINTRLDEFLNKAHQNTLDLLHEYTNHLRRTGRVPTTGTQGRGRGNRSSNKRRRSKSLHRNNRKRQRTRTRRRKR